MGDRNNLQAFVHRALVYRLIAVGVLLSLLVGAIMFFVERQKAIDRSIYLTEIRVSTFVKLYKNIYNEFGLLDEKKMKIAIKDFLDTRSKIEIAAYVFLDVRDLSGNTVVELIGKDSSRIDILKTIRTQNEPKISAKDEKFYSLIEIDDHYYLELLLPIIKDDKKVGELSGFLYFSPELIADFKLFALESILIAIFIIFLTTIILYPVVLRLAKRVAQSSIRLLDANLEMLETLGNAIAQRDSDTDAHNYRVTIYSVHLAEELDLADETVRTLIKGAFLHDVGKIAIPDAILLKPGKLDDSEFEIMKTHVEKGYAILENSKWLKEATDVVLYHHEKLTGDGYLSGLSAEKIPVLARIFTIVDVFDALTSERPYKKAWTLEKAREIMTEGSGTQFDSNFLEVFFRIVKPLYEEFAKDDSKLKGELKKIISTYFYSNISSLED